MNPEHTGDVGVRGPIGSVNSPRNARRARARRERGGEEARRRGGRTGWRAARRTQLGPAQLCPEVGVPADAREGADRRSRAAPAQHSSRAGGLERRPRNCAGAVRLALRGGASLRRAQGWGKTQAGIGRGAARRDVPRVGPDGACALGGRRGG